MSLCPSPSRAVSVSHIPLALLNIILTGFQSCTLLGLVSWCRSSGLGIPMWGSDPLLIRGDHHCVVISLPLVVAVPSVWVLTRLHCAPTSHLNILSCRKSVLLVFRSFSEICSYRFGVFVGGGKLRIFLLCFLDPAPVHIF